MARCTRCAGALAVVLWLHSSGPSAGDDKVPARPPSQPQLELLPNPEATAIRLVTLVPPARQLRHRLYVEVDAARVQAEDWLRDAGFSLLEERDNDGRRSYHLISAALMSAGPTVLLHARLGRPQLSAGLQPRREVPAFGLTMPLEHYALEIEGINDRRLGWAVMSSLRWTGVDRRLQYGIALPMSVGHTPSVGVLLQLQLRFGE